MMACFLVGTKPYSEPMLEYLRTNFSEMLIEIHTFSWASANENVVWTLATILSRCFKPVYSIIWELNAKQYSATNQADMVLLTIRICLDICFHRKNTQVPAFCQKELLWDMLSILDISVCFSCFYFRFSWTWYSAEQLTLSSSNYQII